MRIMPHTAGQYKHYDQLVMPGSITISAVNICMNRGVTWVCTTTHCDYSLSCCNTLAAAIAKDVLACRLPNCSTLAASRRMKHIDAR